MPTFTILKGTGFKEELFFFFFGAHMQSRAQRASQLTESPAPPPQLRLLCKAGCYKAPELGCMDFNESVRQSCAVALRDLQIITKPAVG